jgi:hypothetical protein
MVSPGIVLCVDSVELPHAKREIAIRGLDHEVIVLLFYMPQSRY